MGLSVCARGTLQFVNRVPHANTLYIVTVLTSGSELGERRLGVGLGTPDAHDEAADQLAEAVDELADKLLEVLTDRLIPGGDVASAAAFCIDAAV